MSSHQARHQFSEYEYGTHHHRRHEEHKDTRAEHHHHHRVLEHLEHVEALARGEVVVPPLRGELDRVRERHGRRRRERRPGEVRADLGEGLGVEHVHAHLRPVEVEVELRRTASVAMG